jgi:hypothetical protein
VCHAGDHGIHAESAATKLIRAYGENACGYVAQSDEKSGTTALIFPHGATEVTFRSKLGRWLTADATVHGHRVRITSAYVPTLPAARRQFLAGLHETLQHTALPWIIGGDHNWVPTTSGPPDKFGGNPTTGDTGRDEWAPIEAEFGLTDIALQLGEARPTYVKAGRDGLFIGARLDRFYTNCQATSWTTKAYATSTGAKSKLDHMMITLEVETGHLLPEPKRPRRPLPAVLVTAHYQATTS